MAIQTWTNGYILINSVNLSDHAHQVSVNHGQDTVDASTFGDAHHKSRVGLGRRTIAVTFFNDYAGSSVEPTLRGLVLGSSDVGVAVAVRAANTAESTTNPQYGATCVLDGDLLVVNIGSVGGLQDISANFVPYGAFSVYTSAT